MSDVLLYAGTLVALGCVMRLLTLSPAPGNHLPPRLVLLALLAVLMLFASNVIELVRQGVPAWFAILALTSIPLLVFHWTSSRRTG